MRKLKTKKWLAVAVSCALLLPLLTGMLPGGVSTAEEGCAHVCGDGACAYSEGMPCGHTHDAECGWDEDDLSGCAHAHDTDCGYVKAVSCDHTHDASCGELNTDAPDDPGDSGNPGDPGDGGNSGQESTDPEPPEGVAPVPGILLPTVAVLLTEKDAAGGGASYTITLTITGDDVYDNALYLPRGIPVTDAALLKGVAAVDENGLFIPVTIQGMDGLDRQNPQPRGGFPPQPYTITYAAAHPMTGEVFTVTRAVYVTVEIKPAAYGDPASSPSSRASFSNAAILQISSKRLYIS